MALLAPEVSRILPVGGAAADAPPAPDRAPDWVAGGTPEPLRSDLIATLGEEAVLARTSDLIRYASDASPYRMIPAAVVAPRDTAAVQKLLAYAGRTGTPLTFRAGGTSLNGQSQTQSVMVDVRRHWRGIEVLDAGARVRVRPGTVLGHVNRVLAPLSRRLGPDPASTEIACLGGVIANNSGGMRCGVTADSYSTLESMTLVLADGTVIDTAAPEAESGFAAAAPELAAGLTRIRDEIRADADLAARIRRKFEIKNTTGYRLCAFLDADTPLEIFRRLVVGSEGTLAFLAEAVMRTVPLGRFTTLALLHFADIDAAAAAVGPLVDAGATATELMIAPTLIAASWSMAGTPESWRELPPDSAAVLVEFRTEEAKGLDALEAAAMATLADRTLLRPAAFSRDPHHVEMHWRVREGMQGLLAAVRSPGVQLIIEDVCVPPARVAEAAKDLQALLSEHGFLPGVAGHASAGNLHFLLTPNFGEPADLERYDAFMHRLAALIVDKYDGSLKAEHGTGLNMAPFVEREWGEKATVFMWQIKALADPGNILSPGVVLNRDPRGHLKHLKGVPEIEELATKCIECGFCEPICPSRNVTTTPRQRIVLRREMARQPAGSPVLESLVREYEYDAIETCAADGSCATACPVGIDTGALMKSLRAREHGERSQNAAAAVAGRWAAVEAGTRAGLRAGQGRAGSGALRAVTSAVRAAVSHELVPAFTDGLPGAAPSLPATERAGAAAVYLPACINRMFGPVDGSDHLPSALVAVSARAGLPLWIPPDAAGNCCGVPWASKGYSDGQKLMAERLADSLWRWSGGGALPVVIDASSCTHGVLGLSAPDGALEGERAERMRSLEVLDSVVWAADRLMAKLPVERRLPKIALHPNCSLIHMGESAKLRLLAESLAEEVIVPAGTVCCGMAGDRGLLHPELPASALSEVRAEVAGRHFDACLSSNRTCEIALSRETGQGYESIIIALERLTRDGVGSGP